MRVAVLGVGLIGGSIGLAARRHGAMHVVGYDRDASAISTAVELGAVDEPAFELEQAVERADFVFVAAPVGASPRLAREALDAVGPECVVSDVGSTKRQIVEAISDPRFVGGHPLAGSETAGVENAREDLFDGAVWYLTPALAASEGAAALKLDASGEAVPPTLETRGAVTRLSQLIERLGARPVTIDPHAHDRAMASVSHLPHVFANLLVEQAARLAESLPVVATDSHDGPLGAGPSFKDATRVAGANTAIWTDIYMSNRDALALAIDETIEQLGKVRGALEDGDADALARWNDHVRAQRERLRPTGPNPGS